MDPSKVNVRDVVKGLIAGKVCMYCYWARHAARDLETSQDLLASEGMIAHVRAHGTKMGLHMETAVGL